MLVENGGEPHVRDSFAEFIERRDDVILMGLEIPCATWDAIRADDDYFPVVLLHETGPRECLRDRILSLRRVGKIRPAICGDERQVVFFEQGAHASVGFHGLDLIAEELDAVEARGWRCHEWRLRRTADPPWDP